MAQSVALISYLYTERAKQRVPKAQVVALASLAQLLVLIIIVICTAMDNDDQPHSPHFFTKSLLVRVNIYSVSGIFTNNEFFFCGGGGGGGGGGDFADAVMKYSLCLTIFYTATSVTFHVYKTSRAPFPYNTHNSA